MKAVKTRFRELYIKNKSGNYKVNIPQLRESDKQAGVYLIKSKRTGEIVYIGYSQTQLYKTVTRHFQTWNDSQQERYTYSKTNYLIRIILTTPKRAALLEQYLINKIKPRDNKQKLSFNESDAHKAIEILNDCPFITGNDDCPF
jgi:hypothetical protein